MPELPEVEVIRLGIAPHVEGQVVKDVFVWNRHLRWSIPTRIRSHLLDRRFLSIARQGKYLLWYTDGGCMLMHLGMSGSLRFVPQGTQPRKHDHFAILLASGQALHFHDPRRFGAILWTGSDPLQHKLIKNLGIEPLSKAFNGEYLYQRSRNRSLAIKSFIMDGSNVVGVGNIYANEALFVAGIHPKRKANRNALRRYSRLATVIKQVLSHAIELGGTTLRDFSDGHGSPGYFQQQLYVYGRGGQACRQCGSSIKCCRINQRSAFYCAKCQT